MNNDDIEKRIKIAVHQAVNSDKSRIGSQITNVVPWIVVASNAPRHIVVFERRRVDGMTVTIVNLNVLIMGHRNEDDLHRGIIAAPLTFENRNATDAVSASFQL